MQNGHKLQIDARIAFIISSPIGEYCVTQSLSGRHFYHHGSTQINSYRSCGVLIQKGKTLTLELAALKLVSKKNPIAVSAGPELFLKLLIGQSGIQLPVLENGKSEYVYMLPNNEYTIHYWNAPLGLSYRIPITLSTGEIKELDINVADKRSSITFTRLQDPLFKLHNNGRIRAYQKKHKMHSFGGDIAAQNIKIYAPTAKKNLLYALRLNSVERRLNLKGIVNHKIPVTTLNFYRASNDQPYEVDIAWIPKQGQAPVVLKKMTVKVNQEWSTDLLCGEDYKLEFSLVGSNHIEETVYLSDCDWYEVKPKGY